MYNGFGNALQFLAILAFMVDDHLKLITFIRVGNIFRIVVFTVALFLTFKAMNEKTWRVFCVARYIALFIEISYKSFKNKSGLEIIRP